MYAACGSAFSESGKRVFSAKPPISFSRARFLHPQACNCYYTVYGPVCQYIFRKIFAQNAKNRRISAFWVRKRAVFLKNPLDFFQILPGFGASGAAWVRKNSGSLRCRKAGVSVLRHQPRRSAAAYSRPIPKRNSREAISHCPGPAPADGTARRWGSLRSHSRSCSLCRPFCVCARRLLRWPQIPQQSMPRSGWWERS